MWRARRVLTGPGGRSSAFSAAAAAAAVTFLSSATDDGRSLSMLAGAGRTAGGSPFAFDFVELLPKMEPKDLITRTAQRNDRKGNLRMYYKSSEAKNTTVRLVTYANIPPLLLRRRVIVGFASSLSVCSEMAMMVTTMYSVLRPQRYFKPPTTAESVANPHRPLGRAL